MAHRGLFQELIAAAHSLHARRMWERFANEDCIGLRVPGEADLMLASVMGAGAEQYGLSVFRGPKAVGAFTGLLVDPASGGDGVECLDILGFSMDRFVDLLPETQNRYRQAGMHPRAHEAVPNFIVKRPHRHRVCRPTRSSGCCGRFCGRWPRPIANRSWSRSNWTVTMRSA